jgi:hypothetical protein
MLEEAWLLAVRLARDLDQSSLAFDLRFVVEGPAVCSGATGVELRRFQGKSLWCGPGEGESLGGGGEDGTASPRVGVAVETGLGLDGGWRSDECAACGCA